MINKEDSNRFKAFAFLPLVTLFSNNDIKVGMSVKQIQHRFY